MPYLTAFFSGTLFALGLGVSGMTDPQKIIGFLDVFGHWDPSLVYVMAGAVSLTFLAFPLILRRPKPLLAQRFYVPERLPIDFRLFAGAGLFGIGWGSSGYCPGPALVSLVTLNTQVIVFLMFLVLGLGLGHRTCR
jgi:uncharacterized protein